MHLIPYLTGLLFNFVFTLSLIRPVKNDIAIIGSMKKVMQVTAWVKKYLTKSKSCYTMPM